MMSAEAAAAYCDESSVEAFRRAVGTLYPEPKKVPGKGQRWFRTDLDRAIAAIKGDSVIEDAAEVL